MPLNLSEGLNSEVIKTNYLSCFENYVILLKKTFIQLKVRYIKTHKMQEKIFWLRKGGEITALL
jgi:hypothetical protein